MNNNYQDQSQPQQTTKPFWREYWYVLLFIIAFIILLITYILRSLTPQIPIQENSYQGITPGYSKIGDFKTKFGQAREVIETNRGTQYNFAPEFESVQNNEVVTDQAGTIQFIKELVPFNREHNLQVYTQVWGDYDLHLHKQSFAPAVWAYVFLNKGVVIFAHIDGDVVEEKWYFTPTSEANFLKSWGENLTDTGSGPEQLDIAPIQP